MNRSRPSLTIVERDIGKVPFRMTITGVRGGSMKPLVREAIHLLRLRVKEGSNT